MSPTPLDQDRIDRMREGVFLAVDEDVRRRGRRGRRVRAGAVAACAVAVLAGLVPTYLATTDRTGASSAGDSASSAESPSGGRAEVGDEPPRGDVDAGRQVVVTGSATVRVADPERAAGRLAAWVGDIGGRVDQRSTTAPGVDAPQADATANLTIRVPAARVEAALDELRSLGTVEQVDVGRDDVTARVSDLDARIRSLRTSVERLRGILAEADDADDLLAAERSLSERQGELESLQAQRRVVGDQVALAALTVDLVASDGPATVQPGGFVGGLQSGWDALAATLDEGVRVVGVLLPWLGVGLVVWAAGWGLRRTLGRDVRRARAR